MKASVSVQLAPSGFPRPHHPRATIQSLFIPGGTFVYVNHIAMQLRKDVLGEGGDMFRPERFMECSNEKRAEMERTVEMAFGAGRYQCPGKVPAFIEIYKLVFEVSQNVLK
jgi:cytochrome P450